MNEVINAHVGNNILMLSNGLFGERWREIAEFYNKSNVYKIKNAWGDKFDIDHISSMIRSIWIQCILIFL